MKHIIGREHHPHLKKRAILEIFGLLTLFIITVKEWQIIDEAIFAIRDSDVFYLALALGVYWLSIPLTAISYQLLSKNKIPLFTTSLSQLAGSGPGRIIPGGLGHIGVSVMHLRKVGIPTQKAIVTTVSNNVIGFIVNIFVLVMVLVLQPQIKNILFNDFSYKAFFPILIVAIVLISFIQWLLHAKRTRPSIIKINKQVSVLTTLFRKQPQRLIGVVGISLLILTANVSIFLLAAQALDVSFNYFHVIVSLSAGVFVGGILPTPGGIGGVEAGLVTTLVLLGYDPIQATSATLLFRSITYLQPLIPGTLAYLYLRERKLL